MTRREFEKVVKESLDSLPPILREKIENVQVTVRESPDRRQTAEHGSGLYGLYEGVSLDRRTHDFPERAAMIRCIQETVIHEVGHFFGFDDDQLDAMGIG